MTRVFKLAAVGSFAALIFWWIATSLTRSPFASIPDLDWPNDTNGLTAKFVIQIFTLLLMTVPFVIGIWLVVKRGREGEGRSEKSGKIE